MYMAFNNRNLACLLLLACHPVSAATSDAASIDGLTAANAAIISARFAEHRGLSEIPDTDMSLIEAQDGSLIIADRIGPNELTGASSAGTYANFSYYRMGLDAKLDFNANISKLQLGCGGVNDLLTGPGCDIDIDYASFMGINPAGNAPGIAGSPFQMTRPFVELAFKNENNPAKREVVGFRLGAQSINGALGLGREYATGQLNMEHGGTCDQSVTTGAAVSNCHSGIRSVSGYLGLELAAAVRARARITVLGIPTYTAMLETCFGRIDKYGCDSTPNGTGTGTKEHNANDGTAPFFVDAGGTRLNTLHVAAAKLHINDFDLGCFILDVGCLAIQGSLNGLVDNGYGQLKIDMRQVHYLLTPNTSNFFLSFQRERVSWPNYTKATPPTNIAFDSCNSVYLSRPSRCSSAYSPAANTGWWLNAPGAKILGIDPPTPLEIGDVSISTLLSVFSPEGTLLIDNPKIALVRPDNCHGTAHFC